ncbi:MAG: hypothetical protein PWQ82_1114 [Thermosediminibacterales bacterium]|nr:hypothetical protein [Thermosediminibacterales bacterium]MDK2835692.1 hypothetical protein [Thermosediminibacterales bacterium]
MNQNPTNLFVGVCQMYIGNKVFLIGQKYWVRKDRKLINGVTRILGSNALKFRPMEEKLLTTPR